MKKTMQGFQVITRSRKGIELLVDVNLGNSTVSYFVVDGPNQRLCKTYEEALSCFAQSCAGRKQVVK